MRRGFTLMEFLVVAVLVCVLASLLAPVLSRAQEKGRQAACLNNQRQIATAVTLYLQDHDDTFPDTDVWGSLKLDTEAYICPTAEELSRKHTGVSGTRVGRNDYVYSKFIAGKPHGDIKYPDNELLSADGVWKPSAGSILNILTLPTDIDFRHNDGFVASYCDGHVAYEQEIRPYWMIELSNFGQWKIEVLNSAFPVLVNLRDTAITAPAVEAMVTQVARQFRGRAKVVNVDSRQYPQVEAVCTDPAPAYIIFTHGRPQPAIVGLRGVAPDARKIELKRQELVNALKNILGY